MTTKADGSTECDRCGRDLGNGAITECAIVADLDPDNPGLIRNMHICRAYTDGEGAQQRGCHSSVFTAKALAHLNAQRKAACAT